MTLSECVERYLDAKRSVLLFSKGVILVEGDGEEILIPNMIRKALGVSLDELGIGLVNVGSVSFEYIASLFGEERINRSCAIITDEDVQIVEKSSAFYKESAEIRGKSRKEKLTNLYGRNAWVESFYAPHTLEVDFSLVEDRVNAKYIFNVIDMNYVAAATIAGHKANISTGTDAECANTVLTLARDMGKGWYATILSNYLDCTVNIPQYILKAVAFASREIVNVDIIHKMVEYSLGNYEESEAVLELLEEVKKAKSQDEKKNCIKKYRDGYSEEILSKFLQEIDGYCEGWCE